MSFSFGRQPLNLDNGRIRADNICSGDRFVGRYLHILENSRPGFGAYNEMIIGQ